MEERSHKKLPGSIAATQQAIQDLRISRPGREALDELPLVAFGPNWDKDCWVLMGDPCPRKAVLCFLGGKMDKHGQLVKDIVEWLAIWGTGFICYVADTQYWFVLGCGLLGFVLSVYQRHWRLVTLVSEDAIAAVPQRFAERVILAAPRGQQNRASASSLQRVPTASAQNQWYVKWFPDLWDRSSFGLKSFCCFSFLFFGDLCANCWCLGTALRQPRNHRFHALRGQTR